MFKDFSESQLDVYEHKVFEIINAYQRLINKTLSIVDIAILNTIKLSEKMIFKCVDVVKLTGKLMRYTTFPIHWLWIWWDLNHIEHEGIEDLPTFKVGAHYIYGKPGSGKSTFTYHAMMDYAYHTGKCSYTTASMETPRTDLNGMPYFYHQIFSPSDFFQDGEQVTGFEDERFNFIVYEEMLTQYQQRNNAKKVYNDEVLPMVAAMGTQRHQGIDLFYFISQLPKNDIAIMQMIKGYHEPKIKKGLDYKLWLDTGKIRFKILGWKIKSYIVEPKGGSDYELKPEKTWFYKNKYPEDMKYFNRFNMKQKYAKLEKMKGAKMQA
jgi:hypothetical protein